MARQARIALVDLPHLVWLQGLPGLELIRDRADVEGARETLCRCATDERVAVHGYGFAKDHLVWLATPSGDQALSRMTQAFGRRYVSAYNRRHQRSGTLFSGRFRAAVVAPDGYALLALREAEAAGGPAADAPASSRAHHEGRTREAWLVPLAAYWSLGNTPFERERRWAESVDLAWPGDWTGRLRQALGAGGALGEPAFVAECRVRAGRPAQAGQRGRPVRRPLG